MFKEICLGSTWLEDFIQLNERSGQRRVTPVGRFVETMYLFRTENMTFDGFRRVVNCFPNLKRLMLCPTTFKDNHVSKYLLEIDDSMKWDLHSLKTKCMIGVEMKLYYKYKHSIKEIIVPSHIKDLQFLKSFPMLEGLYLQSLLALTTMQDFMFIFDTCHYMFDFSAWFELEEDINLPPTQGCYPYLTRLTVQTTKSLIPKKMIDNITKRFVNLSDISLIICLEYSTLDLLETYCQLLRFLMISPKTSLKLKIGLEQFWRTSEEILADICEYFNNT